MGGEGRVFNRTTFLCNSYFRSVARRFPKLRSLSSNFNGTTDIHSL